MRNNAIILCSGIGRRMSPIPRCNKSLLHIKGDEPNVERTCRILYRRGIHPINLVAHPDDYEEFVKIRNSLQEEGIPVRVYSVDEYTPGCNNIVSLKSVSHVIGSTYIIEGDQYLLDEHCSFLREDPYPTSRFFTQIRESEDWAVVCEFQDVGRISRVLHYNPNPTIDFCLAGISYISYEDSNVMRSLLSAHKSIDIYWEEVIDFHEMVFVNHKCYTPYALEYDNIHDLVRKKLMASQDIADLIDENHSATRLDSMTNTSYLVNYNGCPSVLRIPGYGTEVFVNRNRESTIENYLYSMTNGRILPKSVYYSEGHVKLTEYLPKSEYHIFHDIKEFPSVLLALQYIHSVPLPRDVEEIRDLTLNIETELRAYESIFKEVPAKYTGYWSIREKVLDIVSRYPLTGFVHRDLVPRNILISDDGDVKFIDWEYSCIFNKYWDLASLACEYVDEYTPDPASDSMESLEKLITLLYILYPDVELRDIYLWIAVVDFVWSSWSLAKIVLGDEIEEYLDHRYTRCKFLLDKYYKEI